METAIKKSDSRYFATCSGCLFQEQKPRHVVPALYWLPFGWEGSMTQGGGRGWDFILCPTCLVERGIVKEVEDEDQTSNV